MKRHQKRWRNKATNKHTLGYEPLLRTSGLKTERMLWVHGPTDLKTANVTVSINEGRRVHVYLKRFYRMWTVSESSWGELVRVKGWYSSLPKDCTAIRTHWPDKYSNVRGLFNSTRVTSVWFEAQVATFVYKHHVPFAIDWPDGRSSASITLTSRFCRAKVTVLSTTKMAAGPMK